MRWYKDKQRSHCLYSFGLLIALLGEFPQEELNKPSNSYLLRSCVALHNILLECVGLCGIVRLSKAQKRQADENTVEIINTAVFKSIERGYVQFARHKVDLYSWLQCWQCGYWASQDAFKMCKDLQERPLTWKLLKESLESIDQYLEDVYGENYPDLQEDGWALYEKFQKDTEEKPLKVQPNMRKKKYGK